MLKSLILYTLLAISLFLSEPLSAAEQSKQTLAQCLNLTSEQQAAIQSIQEQSQQTMRACWKRLKLLQVQMIDLISAKTIDDSQLDAFIEQKIAILAVIMKTKITIKNRIYNSLTSSQQQKYLSLLTARKNSKDSQC